MADRIVKTAHDLIAECGYSAFSYADIAKSVVFRKPSIHLKTLSPWFMEQ
nr:TetR family transcriptional regulator [Granulicella mallensis]